MTESIAGQPAPELAAPYWIDAEGKERLSLTLKDLGARHRLLFFYQHWYGGCHSHGFPTFVLFPAWILSNYASSGGTIAWNSLLFVVLSFLRVLLHEFGHIFTARALGVPTPYVTLPPIGGVAQAERIREPSEDFLSTIAVLR
jgi:Zn-dependent protease